MTTFDKCKRDLLVDLLKTSHKATYLRENGYDIESYDCLEEVVADYLLESGFVKISPIRAHDVFYEISGGETYGAKNPRKPYYLTEQIASWIEGGIIKTQDGRRICLECFGTLIFTDKDKALEALNKMNDKAAEKYDEWEMICISDSDYETRRDYHIKEHCKCCRYHTECEKERNLPENILQQIGDNKYNWCTEFEWD